MCVFRCYLMFMYLVPPVAPLDRAHVELQFFRDVLIARRYRRIVLEGVQEETRGVGAVQAVHQVALRSTEDKHVI